MGQCLPGARAEGGVRAVYLPLAAGGGESGGKLGLSIILCGGAEAWATGTESS